MKVVALLFFVGLVGGTPLLIAGCGSSEPEPATAGPISLPATIGPAGGTVEGSDEQGLSGLKIEIPEGALSEPTKVDARIVHDPTPLKAPSFFVGSHIAFEPKGLVFKKPVRLTIPIHIDDVTELQSQATDCKVWMREGEGWKQVPQVASTNADVTIETTTLETSAAGVNFSGIRARFPAAALCDSSGGYCFSSFGGLIDPSASGFSLVKAGVTGFTVREPDGAVSLGEYDLNAGQTILGPRPTSSAGLGEASRKRLVRSGDEYYNPDGPGIWIFPRTAPKRFEPAESPDIRSNAIVFNAVNVRYTLFQDRRTNVPPVLYRKGPGRTGAKADPLKIYPIALGGVSLATAAIPDSPDFMAGQGPVCARFRDADPENPDKFAFNERVERWLEVATGVSTFALVGIPEAGFGTGRHVVISSYDHKTLQKFPNVVGAGNKIAMMTDESVFVSGSASSLIHFKKDGTVVTIDLDTQPLTFPVEERVQVRALFALPNNELMFFVGAPSRPGHAVKLRIAP